MAKETIKWIIRRGKYKASFNDFVVACCLDYNFMKNGEQMNALPKVKEEEAARFYASDDYEFLQSKGLKMEPSVLNSLLCCTVMPKGGNSEYEVLCGHQIYLGWRGSELG